MKVSLLVLALLGLAYGNKFLDEAKENANCLVYHDFTFWDFRPLENDLDYSAKGTEGTATHKYYFNFCRKPTHQNEGEENPAWVTDNYSVTGSYIANSGSTSDDVRPVILKDTETGAQHIKFVYTNGDACPYNSADKTFSVEVQCAPGLNGLEYVKKDVTDYCNPKVIVKSSSGCPAFEATAAVKFLGNHPWILAIVMIVFGLFSCLYGYKFFYIIIGTITGGIAFLFSMLLFSLMGLMDGLDHGSTGKLALAVVLVIVCIVIGAVVGFFIAKLTEKIGGILIGTVLGFFGGVTLYNLLLASTANMWLLLLCAVVGVVVGAFIGWKFFDKVVIIGSSILGAYLFIRGISLFAGHYPSEFLIYQEAANGVNAEFEWQFLVYVVCMVIMALIGMKVQFTKSAADEDFKKTE